jgi:DNA processing protein
MRQALELFGGTAEGVWTAPLNDFLLIPGVAGQTLAKISQTRKTIDPETEYARLEKSGAQLLCWNDSHYPELLRQIHDPPLALFYKGLAPLAAEACLAIVGSRHPTPYGRTMAESLTRDLAQSGFTIVSGLARGIDTVAHTTALQAGARTLAVLGCGIDEIYPPENKDLYAKIQANGTIFSELPLGSPPLAEHFPGRNRLITGLSQGVVIVQAKEKSGAMISARFALEQNREVFAVPGPVGLAQSAGPHQLIKQGAKLVESVNDILEEFHWRVPTSAADCPAGLSAEATRLWNALPSAQPIHIDMLSLQYALSVDKLAAILLELEFHDALEQLPGQYLLRKCVR